MAVPKNWEEAFDRLCLQHVRQIRVALGIAGVHVEAYAWNHVPDETYPVGAQIDLLLDRSDGVVNVCETRAVGNNAQ